MKAAPLLAGPLCSGEYLEVAALPPMDGQIELDTAAAAVADVLDSHWCVIISRLPCAQGDLLVWF